MNQESNLAQAEDVVQLNFRVPPSLDKRLAQAVIDSKSKTTKTELVRQALETFLDGLDSAKEDETRG